MATGRAWIYGLLGIACALMPGATTHGQEGGAERALTTSTVRMDLGSCLSAARDALAGGDLDSAEGWAAQAERTSAGFMGWLKAPWSDTPAKVWRDIQAARKREEAAKLAIIQEMPAPPATEPGPRFSAQEKKVEWPLFRPTSNNVSTEEPPLHEPSRHQATQLAGVQNAFFATAAETPWNKDELEHLQSYLRNNFGAYQNKAAPGARAIPSEDLLMEACARFLQGNYQEARALGLKAREADGRR